MALSVMILDRFRKVAWLFLKHHMELKLSELP